VPPDPEEFLRQADAMTAQAEPTQVDLRRAISNAYYALFHLSLTAAADMLLTPTARNGDLYALIYRGVEHARLRDLCKHVSATTAHESFAPFARLDGYGDLATFANLLAGLYEQRNTADYDPSKSFTAAEANGAIADAREAIKAFRTATDEQRRAFLAVLLLPFKIRTPPAA
jgi:uncharacterized protein (UPF0332 family)